MVSLAYGAESMTAPLRRVLVKRPAETFGRAFETPAHGFLHPVDLARAQAEHDAFCELLADLGVEVEVLAGECASPDLIYTFDPALVTRRGLVALRSGKPTRVGEEDVLAGWAEATGIPIGGRIEAPGTVDGGDTLWLDEDTLFVGRTLRTNTEGARQLDALVDPEVEIVDMPYAGGPAECLHLLSVVSPVTPDLAVVFLPMLPVGLWTHLCERGTSLVPVPEEEFPTLGCNVLAVRPGVCVMADGNPETRQALLDRGCEVHTYAAAEIGLNGSGGPTCLTRPVLRG